MFKSLRTCFTRKLYQASNEISRRLKKAYICAHLDKMQPKDVSMSIVTPTESEIAPPAGSLGGRLSFRCSTITHRSQLSLPYIICRPWFWIEFIWTCLAWPQWCQPELLRYHPYLRGPGRRNGESALANDATHAGKKCDTLSPSAHGNRAGKKMRNVCVIDNGRIFWECITDWEHHYYKLADHVVKIVFRFIMNR